MASWDDLVSYVRVRYEVMRQGEGELWFDIPTGDERQQLVMVRQAAGPDGQAWVQIASPVGAVDDVDLGRLLDLASDFVVGGAVALDGVVVFRHTILLSDSAPTAFDRSFHQVVEAADRLEEELTGTDVH